MANPDDDDGPLVDESTVELYQRVRREARLPAKPDAEAVGALSELITSLRDARRLWTLAEETATSSETRDRLQEQAAAMLAEAEELCRVVRDFGGLPPRKDAVGERLPFSARDLDYAGDDAAIEAGLDGNREHLRMTRQRLAERDQLTDDVRRLIARGNTPC